MKVTKGNIMKIERKYIIELLRRMVENRRRKKWVYKFIGKNHKKTKIMKIMGSLHRMIKNRIRNQKNNGKE